MYIVDYKQQNRMMNEMHQVRKDIKNYEVYFHHTLTDQMWKSFFPRAVGKDLGPKLLRHEPAPESLVEHISICLKERMPEDAIGLGIEFSTQINRWPELIRIVEENRKKYGKKQVHLFLKHLRITRFKENIRQLGMRSEDLELSDKDLRQLRWRALKLRMLSYL